MYCAAADLQQVAPLVLLSAHSDPADSSRPEFQGHAKSLFALYRQSRKRRLRHGVLSDSDKPRPLKMVYTVLLLYVVG